MANYLLQVKCINKNSLFSLGTVKPDIKECVIIVWSLNLALILLNLKITTFHQEFALFSSFSQLRLIKTNGTS